MVVLAKEYMDLEQMTLWSMDAAKVFNSINKDCTRVVQAIRAMVPSGFGVEKQLLARFARLDQTLGRQSQDGDTEDVFATTSVFHAHAGPTPSEKETKAIPEGSHRENSSA